MKKEKKDNKLNIKSLGEYKVLEEIGSGGFGTVYKVEDPGGQIYAAKVPTKKHEWFITEMYALRNLRHPNIISVIDIFPEHEPPFYVMEYVKEGNLEDRLAGPLECKATLALAQNALQGLIYAKKHGVLHADLKPSNVLMSDPPKIADFGLIAKIDPEGFKNSVSMSSKSVSKAGRLMGTYDYMSREQKQGNPLTEQDSIYSLGKIMYHMLTGVLPDGARSISEINPEIPGSVSEIVQKAMDPPEKRYKTLEEFEQEISRLLGHTSTRVLPESLSNRYVPAKMLPKKTGIYTEGVKNAIEHARKRLEGDLAKKVEKAVDVDENCEIISKTAEVRITKQLLKGMNLQYYAVELVENSNEYVWYDGNKKNIRPCPQGSKIKRAIELCKANNHWDLAPEEGAEVFHKKEDLKFRKPVWHYPQNHIRVGLEIDVSVMYSTKRRVDVGGNELKRAVVAQTWTASKRYQREADIFFSGSENFAISMNDIKLDNLILSSNIPSISYSSRPAIPYYVSVPAGIIPFFLSAFMMPDFLTGAIVCPIIATLSSTLVSLAYRKACKDDIAARKELREREQENLKFVENSLLTKQVSLCSGYFELNE